MDYVKAISDTKISFFEMVPMNELSKYLRHALSYVLNIYTSHYDSLIKFRYYTQDIVFGIELVLQLLYLTRT